VTHTIVQMIETQQRARSGRPLEVVERKGIGHPDTICDALAEEFAVALARFYVERFGLILHHNVDKVLLRGGAARAAFGGGRIMAPIELYMCGRATEAYKGVRVPVAQLAVDATRAWLRKNIPALDPARHVRVHCLVRPGSTELVDLFERAHRTGVWLANDTSLGVGFAPLSPIERAVLAIDRDLRRPAARRSIPGLGADLKIMAVGRGDQVALTVANAFVGKFVRDITDYAAQKTRLTTRIAATVRRAGVDATGIAVNAADDMDRGSIYLTVTGTSAEAGDDGEVGRGNRANGLITPGRPMTMEAAAGKNCVSHVGKLYNIVARSIAERLVRELPAIAAAECWLVSRIGSPVSEPQTVSLRLQMTGARKRPSQTIEAIVRQELSRTPQLWRAVLRQRITLY
jgi:S-adenosylmethionine synthetase